MNKRYEKQSGESDYEYGLRLITIKVEEKPDDLEWQDIVDLLHLDVHRDTLRKSVNGSPYSGYSVLKYFKGKQLKCAPSDELMEIKKATIQLRDERNELNKKYREISRADKLMSIFRDIISETVLCEFEPHSVPSLTGDNDIVVLLSDIHYGIGVDNIYNTCNTSVIKQRLEDYLSEIIEIRNLHKSENCYLVLGGDLISGMIHSTIRIENIENVVSQIKGISVLISHFVNELSKIFFNVHVYETPGNHSRLFQNKDDNQKGDLLDTLIPHYLKASLQNQTNVHIHDNYIDEEICAFIVRGHKIVGVHGDKDPITSIVDNMKRMVGYTPDVVVVGHRHNNGLKTVDKVKVVQNGSLSGMDNHTVNRRIIGTPEQMVFVVSEKRCIAGLYDIQFE